MVRSVLKQMPGFPKGQETAEGGTQKPPGALLDLRPRPEGSGRTWDTEHRRLCSRRPQSFLPLFEACLALEGFPVCPATSDSPPPKGP